MVMDIFYMLVQTAVLVMVIYGSRFVTVALLATTDLRDNSWHHIAVTYDGNTAKIFVDGQLEGENSFETGFQGK